MLHLPSPSWRAGHDEVPPPELRLQPGEEEPVALQRGGVVAVGLALDHEEDLGGAAEMATTVTRTPHGASDTSNRPAQHFGGCSVNFPDFQKQWENMKFSSFNNFP